MFTIRFPVFFLIVTVALFLGCSSGDSSEDHREEKTVSVDNPPSSTSPSAHDADEGEESGETEELGKPEGLEGAHGSESAGSLEDSENAVETGKPGNTAAAAVPAEAEESEEPADPVESTELADTASADHSETSQEQATPPEAGVQDTPNADVQVPDHPVRVEPTKTGLDYIGVDRCAKCHKIQHVSWLETEHAKLVHPLDCEGCHGPGNEYKSLKVMKDPAAARAAGLVTPRPEFCANCHVAGWDDEMLEQAHAHKNSGN